MKYFNVAVIYVTVGLTGLFSSPQIVGMQAAFQEGQKALVNLLCKQLNAACQETGTLQVLCNQL